MTGTMSTEDALQAELDADPGNHTLRMVLADYLDEVGDPRAEGYRLLGKLEVTASPTKMADLTSSPQWFYCWGSWFNGHCQRENWQGEHQGMLLPGKLMNNIPHVHEYDFNYHVGKPDYFACWRFFDTCRQADDAAALAWLKLTESEKIAVLENPMSGLLVEQRMSGNQWSRNREHSEV